MNQDFGDAIVNKAKSVEFNIVNISDKPIQFKWNVVEPGFSFLPWVSHLRQKSLKLVKVKFFIH